MKSPLAKLRSMGLNKGDSKGKWDHNLTLPIDGLTQAAKDMKEMRTCYDSLLSAAAATANSAYEFSESLMEMGNCLLEKTTMHDDEESKRALSMLGNVQLELQKLVDSYRSHIIMTITNPSECLLGELRKVEEMKLQSDEKREMYEYMVGQIKEKGKSRHGKGETFSLQQLKVISDEYDDAARLCIFRVESLKQGQSRSLLTQAARHHAVQLNFFRKGHQSLEAVEPYIKNVAERQHIDYDLSELNEGDRYDDEGSSFVSNDYRELSFDLRLNEQDVNNTSTLRNSMELDAPNAQTSWMKDAEVQTSQGKNEADQLLGQRHRATSHSAPIYAEKFDVADRAREIRVAIPKLTTYVLPTPADAKGSSGSTSAPLSSPILAVGNPKTLWHSSPLDIEKPKRFTDDQLSARILSKTQMAVEESNNNKHLLPLPPSTEVVETQKMRKPAFSGPISTKPSFNFPHVAISSQAPSLSPALATSPKISELHELPRPPDTCGSKPIGALGHSAPLVNRNREVSPTFKQRKEGSPLPLPQLTVPRSFSIPSRDQRGAAFHFMKSYRMDEVASPPLTPMNLKSPKIRGIARPIS